MSISTNTIPTIYAIVVTYNGKKWYDKCLGSLQKSSIPLKVIVVDNASTDDTVEYIKQKYSDVHLIESSVNLGFAKANNIGIRYAYDNGADYVFLLNQDAWVLENTIELLLDSFRKHNDAGIVSPMHLNGTMSALDFNFSTSLSADFYSDCYLNKLKGDYVVNYVNAAAWLISRCCIETVGGFDTNLFVHYGEDINYCKRIKYHKYLLYVNHKAIACHDREFRKQSNNQYKTYVFTRDERIHRMKSELSNINIDVNIDSIISANKKSYIKSLLHFKFAQARRLKLDNQVLPKIKKSRELSQRGGLLWL